MRQSNLASCISQVIVFYTRTLVFYFVNTDITKIILYLILIWRCQEEKKKVVVVVVVSFGVLF